MTEIVTIGDATLYHGDCLEILPTLDKVDAVVTDPPYGISLNPDNTRFSGGSNSSKAKRGKGVSSANTPKIKGDNGPFDPSHLVGIAPDAIIWGWNNYPDKLPAGTCLVWLKRNDAAFQSFLSDAETAWMSKGHGVYCRRDLSLAAIAKYRSHPTQKPVSIMEWCLSFIKDAESILDPYMGSGTTGVACANLGRKFIGIEIEKKYFDIACERIEAAYSQGRLFA